MTLAKLKDNGYKIKEVIWARICLRRCDEVGSLVRLIGHAIVDNHGTIRLGSKVRLRANQVPIELATRLNGLLTIDDGTAINSGTTICAQTSVQIGKKVMIGNYCMIMDTDFHAPDDFTVDPASAPIKIEDDVWLAARVIVLKGVTIGQGSVVSAGSVVAVNVPPYTLVGGSPARMIRRLNNPNVRLEMDSPSSGAL